MKKLSVSLFALLAIAFAVGSAFTLAPKKVVLEDYVVYGQGTTGYNVCESALRLTKRR